MSKADSRISLLLTNNIYYDFQLGQFPVQLCGKLKLPSGIGRLGSELMWGPRWQQCFAEFFKVKSCAPNKHKLTSIASQDRPSLEQYSDFRVKLWGRRRTDISQDRSVLTTHWKSFLKNISGSISMFLSPFWFLGFSESQNPEFLRITKNVSWKMTCGGPLLLERDLLPMIEQVSYSFV